MIDALILHTCASVNGSFNASDMVMQEICNSSYMPY